MVRDKFRDIYASVDKSKLPVPDDVVITNKDGDPVVPIWANNLENITAEVGSSAVDAFNEQWRKENISSLEQENTLGNVMSDFKNMLTD